MRLSPNARGAVSAENARRAMTRRGVTPNGYRLWDPPEARNLRYGYPDYDGVMAINTRRTRTAHHSKARRMGITTPRARDWDPNELFKLHQLFPRATQAELLQALPGRTWKAICNRARADGYRRKARPLKPTGNAVLDQILERARRLNWSRAELDAETNSRRYFELMGWRNGRWDQKIHIRAVQVLGGQLRACWMRPPSPLVSGHVGRSGKLQSSQSQVQQ